MLEQLYRTAMDGKVSAQKAWLARQADHLGAAEALGKKAQLDADAADTPPSEWAALLKH